MSVAKKKSESSAYRISEHRATAEKYLTLGNPASIIVHPATIA